MCQEGRMSCFHFLFWSWDTLAMLPKVIDLVVQYCLKACVTNQAISGWISDPFHDNAWIVKNLRQDRLRT